MIKRFIPSIILFAVISVLLCYAYTEGKKDTARPDPMFARQEKYTLDANKFNLPAQAMEYVSKKYPDGLVPLPLNPKDRELVKDYLKEGSDYIIEFRDEPSLLYIKGTNPDLKAVEDNVERIKASHSEVIKMLGAQINGGSKIRREYSSVFNALSITNASDEDLARISMLDSVEAIYPVRQVHMLLSESVPMTGAPDAWGMLDSYGRNITGQGVKIAVIDTGVDYSHPDLGNCTDVNTYAGKISYSLQSSHPYANNRTLSWTITLPGFTNVSLHFKEIDTEQGFDYLRISDPANSMMKVYSGAYNDTWSPAFPGNTVILTLYSDAIINGWGFEIDSVINGSSFRGLGTCPKVVGGYDYVSDDEDPMDDMGHGTHCAGIAAGNGSLKGVAPDAKILAYKVLDAYGDGEEDDVIAAIDQAVSDGADVISLSLGVSGGDPDDALSQAVDNAVSAGAVVVVAAGNEGPDNGTIASPGCARKALTVGAIYKENDSTRDRMSNLSVDGLEKGIDSLALTDSALTTGNGIRGEMRYAGLGFAGDFAGKSLTGLIALMERGNLTFQEKVRNAYNAGAVGAIIFNNYYGNFKGDLLNLSNIPAISISEEDGETLLSLIENGTAYANMTVAVDPNMIADFSSRGPAQIFNKPDVLAPGVNICSARWGLSFPESPCRDSMHVSLSGTSMATPHVAGAAALLKQEDPSWSPLQIKAALKDTAHGFGYDKNTQGAGEINISAAVRLTSPPPVAMITGLGGVRYEEK